MVGQSGFVFGAARRGRLELGERLAVAAEHGQHLAERNGAGHRRVAERHRLAQVRVGLGVRVQLAGTLGGVPPPLRGLGVAPSALQMPGNGGRPRAHRIPLVPAGERVSGAAVQQPAAGQGRGLVDDVAQRLIGEVIGRPAAISRPGGPR